MLGRGVACGIPNTSSGGFEIFAFYRLPFEMRGQAFLRTLLTVVTIGSHQMRSDWSKCQRPHYEWQAQYWYMARNLVPRI